MPNYSVLMSVYKKEDPSFLKQAIDSMFAQTLVTDDFVLVCDGPLTEKLDQVIREEEEAHAGVLKVLRREKNEGLGPALNAGLSLCKNDYVARMDSDDLADPKRCQEELDRMEEEGLDLVGSFVNEFEKDPKLVKSLRQPPVSHEEIMAFAKKRNPFNHPSVMFSKKAVEAAGGYQDMPLFEDYYLWVRMLMQGSKGANIKRPLLSMRVGEGDELVKRRGGWSYAKCILHFRKTIYQMGFTKRKDYLMSTLPHVMVALMPNRLRSFVYRKFLRK